MFLLVLINLALLSTPDVGWHHTVIDSTGRVDLPDFRLDAGNLPHIAYEKDGAIWYAHQEGIEWTWSTELVGVGEDPSIDVMPNGDPVIAYCSSVNQIALATKHEEEWLYEIYSDETEELTGPLIAISESGITHLVYFRWENDFLDQLRYANNGGSGWNPIGIQSYSLYFTSTDASLDLDSNGYARVSAIEIEIDWKKADSYWLHLYIQDASGAFSTSTIAVQYCRERPGLSAISNTHTGICYRWENPIGLVYEEYPGGQTTELYQGGCYDPDLDCDSEGNPHAVFISPTAGSSVVYATKEGIHRFTEFSSTSHRLDIELDQFDQPHIVFNNNDFLNYLWYGFPTGIEGESSPSSLLIASISPSPASNEISVKINPGNEGQLILSVYDLAGRAVIQTTAAENTTTIDLSDLSPGVYCIRAFNENGSDTRLFTKMSF